MPRGGPPTYTYSLPAIYLAVPGTLITAAQHNTPLEDIASTLNTAWPINLGGTGGTSKQGAVSSLFDGTTTVDDDNFIVAYNADGSKRFRFDASALPTGTTEVAVPIGGQLGTVVETFRNRIVNGDKRVSQQNQQTAGTTNGYYLSDQNAMYLNTSAGVFTGVNVISSPSPKGGFRDRITITTADASLGAGELLTYTQNLEGSNVADLMWGTSSAKPIVVRRGFRYPAGTWPVAFHNSAANRSYVTTFTVSAGEANTDIERVFAIPGDTSGTWLATDGVIGITMDAVIGAGSTYQGVSGWQAGNILTVSGASNGMAMSGAVFEFFDEGLKLDPDATGVYGAYEVGPTDAVYRSQRYAKRIAAPAGAYVLYSAYYNASNYSAFIDLGVEMCKVPTTSGVTWSGTAPTAYHTVNRLAWFSSGVFYSTNDVLALARL